MPWFWQTIFILLGSFWLTACGDQPDPPTAPAPPPAAVAKPVAVSEKVMVSILPTAPTSSDCLSLHIDGMPANSRISWRINEQPAGTGGPVKLCGGFRRGDKVAVKVGSAETGGETNVTIANSPPRITSISSTPDQVFADSNIQITPAAEDKDDDPVEFRYQWLINGEASPFLTEATLPENYFNKGDVIQLRITPFDGFDEGPVYESYKMTIPNAPPRIESNPPQTFESLEYSYQVRANDPDDDNLAWRLDKAPQGMTINPADGLVSWPLAGVKPGAYPMRIVVSDPDGAEAFQEFTLTLGAQTETSATDAK